MLISEVTVFVESSVLIDELLSRCHLLCQRLGWNSGLRGRLWMLFSHLTHGPSQLLSQQTIILQLKA